MNSPASCYKELLKRFIQTAIGNMVMLPKFDDFHEEYIDTFSIEYLEEMAKKIYKINKSYTVFTSGVAVGDYLRDWKRELVKLDNPREVVKAQENLSAGLECLHTLLGITEPSPSELYSIWENEDMDAWFEDDEKYENTKSISDYEGDVDEYAVNTDFKETFKEYFRDIFKKNFGYVFENYMNTGKCYPDEDMDYDEDDEDYDIDEDLYDIDEDLEDELEDYDNSSHIDTAFELAFEEAFEESFEDAYIESMEE